MSDKPRIFISAVSKELHSARQLVANTLVFLGYEPVWQDIFGTEQGNLRKMLRQKIGPCEGLIQLVGQRFGYSPTNPESDHQAESYTQYELRYARKRGKKVWPILLADVFPADAPNNEKEPLPSLQMRYREFLRSTGDLYQSAADVRELEMLVLKLRQPLEELRARWETEQRNAQRFRRVTGKKLTLLAIIGFIVISLGLSLLKGNNQTNRALMEAIRRLPAENRRMDESEHTRRALLFTELEKKYHLPAGTVAHELPGFAKKLSVNASASTYERAEGAYAAMDYAEGERLALIAANEAKKLLPPNLSEIIRALELAGWSSSGRQDHVRAIGHFTAANALADQNRDPVEWARVNYALAYALYDRGEYVQTEAILREVLRIWFDKLGPEQWPTLFARNNLANALDKQGKTAEAEAEHRIVLKIRERLLGPDHPETLKTRHNLAVVLHNQGKYTEAETLHRAVLNVRSRVLGPEHIETLKSRHNLAFVLADKGRYADAKVEYRNLIRIEERVLGPEHPQTLASRNNLALALTGEGKSAEAEAEYRAVLKLEERVLGPDHPQTLASRMGVATMLDEQGKSAEAELEHRAVLKVKERVLGSEHPETLKTRDNLASALYGQSKYREAEEELRAVIRIAARVLGAEHPKTLSSRNNLGSALFMENRVTEAEAEHRTVFNIRERILGPEHPDTLASRYNLALVIEAQGEAARAEEEERAILNAREHVLGLDHPDTVMSLYHLAGCLKKQGKIEAAKDFAMRAVSGCRKVLRPEHPLRKSAEELYQELTSPQFK